MVYFNSFHYSIVMVVRIQVQAVIVVLQVHVMGNTSTLRALKYRCLVQVL
jgi:hypothetical protein